MPELDLDRVYEQNDKGDWGWVTKIPDDGPGSSAWGEASTAKFSGSGSPVGVVTPTGEGDLYVDETTPGLWQANGTTNTDWTQVGSGGSQPWVLLFDSDDLTDTSPAWTGKTEVGGGVWEIAAGVISQTDDTSDDDTDKTLALDLSSYFTADVLAGITGLLIECEYRADMPPGDNFGQILCPGSSITLGIITQDTDWVVYEQSGADPFIVAEGDWSPQSIPFTAVATAITADGEVCDDGGGTGGVPKAVGLNYGLTAECAAYVGGFWFGGSDIKFKTTNAAGSFRRLRILALYGQPEVTG